jgi:hypothetical protein
MFYLPIPTLIYLREIYIFPESVLYFAAAKYVDRSWEKKIARDLYHEPWAKKINYKLRPKDNLIKLELFTIYLFFSHNMKIKHNSPHL